MTTISGGSSISNQDPQLQRLVCCPCTTPQCVAHCITATGDGQHPTALPGPWQAMNHPPGGTVCHFGGGGGSLGFKLPVNRIGIVLPGVRPSLRASSKEITSGFVGILLVFST